MPFFKKYDFAKIKKNESKEIFFRNYLNYAIFLNNLHIIKNKIRYLDFF